MEWVEAWVGVWACLFRMCWEERRGEKGRWLTPPPPQTHPPKPLDPMAENHCQLSWNAYPCLHQSKQGLLVNKEPDWATAVLVRSYFKELTATNRMWSWGSRRRFMLHLSLSVAKNLVRFDYNMSTWPVPVPQTCGVISASCNFPLLSPFSPFNIHYSIESISS